jgi:two-component system OmpR family response regulator
MNLNCIMLVDDEPDIRTIAELSLATVGGWKVVPVASGEEALDRFAAERPDLVLLDVMMPNMDGPAVLQQLKERDDASDVPVIFMTAKAQRREIDQYLAIGARGVINKPFDPMKLPDEIRRIVEGH